jgi:hypothetical protein
MHDVAHITLVMEIDNPNSQWHIVRLLPNSIKRCWAMQTITWSLCNAKVRFGKHGNSAPTYKERKKEFPSTNNVEDGFWHCHDDIKRCVIGNKNEYVKDWLIVPNTWLLKMVINLSREKALELEYAMFQL